MRAGPSRGWLLLVGLLLSLIPVHAPITSGAAAAAETYAGWAVEAYPELSAAEMGAMVRRIAGAGANVIWIGHNNPGEVDASKAEPGLSYAVYEAYLDAADPRHGAAVQTVQAQRDLLAACRAAGIKAVLPVGYQIQMGAVWNSDHPADLRRDAQGRLLDIYGGGVSASFYAASYRRDIEAYYRWVDAELVQPFADVLLMLNLADEPIGGDYSAAADAEFERQTGFGFDEVSEDPARQQLLGAFQAHYVVEFASFSAGLWQSIHPGLPVTLSFDGAQARSTLTLPDVEALFRDTPQNLVITFDAYPHDGLPAEPASDEEMNGLFLLARSLGFYSARYGKPLWLWAAANRWGLSQDSPEPKGVSDAVANGLGLAVSVRQGGGDLRGIVYWNYNVKGQGLYNDLQSTRYDREAMFARVSASFSELRRLMVQPAGRPDTLILAPAAVTERAIGAAREAVRLQASPYGALMVLARGSVNAAVVGELDAWPLAKVRTVVALPQAASDVGQADVEALRGFLERGGKVVASANVAAALGMQSSSAPRTLVPGLVEARGNLYVAVGMVAQLFTDGTQTALLPFWKEALGLTGPRQGYQGVAGTAAFYYNPGPEAITVEVRPPSVGFGYRFDAQARPVQPLFSPGGRVTLGTGEYVLLGPIKAAYSRSAE